MNNKNDDDKDDERGDEREPKRKREPKRDGVRPERFSSSPDDFLKKPEKGKP